MARIRTVKPEFFKHEELFEAELETGLPLRLAFAGLWTQCDREGRFVWRPRQLKTDILPYDDLDFSRVLDAFASRGFVVKYTSGNRDFGHIPSWHRHQVINNRETASVIPDPIETVENIDASKTREARVDHAGKAEGKGKEGKEEPKGSLSETSSDHFPKSKKRFSYPEAFEDFWKAYPTTSNMSKKEAGDAWKKLDADDRAVCRAAIPGYIAFLKTKPDLETIHACRFISKRRFEGFTAPTAAGDAESWRKRLVYGRQEKTWSTRDWGPPPGHPGCRVPPELIIETDGAGWREWEQAA